MARSAQLASRFAVIGAGRMAEAMVGGMMGKGIMPASHVHIFDTNSCRMQHYERRWEGLQTHASAGACVEDADLVLLAVKPQHMRTVLSCISERVPQEALVVSIAAGVPLSTFEGALPNTPAVCRAMPNTPAMVGAGMSVWTTTEGCTESQSSQAKRLLGCFGEEMYVSEEQYLDMATALVGSGPAYTFLFMEAMIDTGVHMGFPREVAEKLVIRTVEGSTKYLLETKREQPTTHIATLRNDITSPGGTTAAAVYTSEGGGFRTTIADSIWAAYRRSLELGGTDSNVGPGRAKGNGNGV